MSFIYDDKKLIQDLVDAGKKDLEKFAQKRPLDTENPYDNKAAVPTYEIAQKLLFGLQRDLGDSSAPAAGAPIGVENADPTQPQTLPTALPKDLRTLGDFLQWAAAKKITWQGKRFAWTKEEVESKRDQPEDPTQKAWEFSSMRSDRNDRRVDRQPETVQAYADKDGLIEYLSYLRDSEDAKTNRVLSFMLATLIGEANAYLRVAGQNTIDPRSKPGAKVDIDPETIVDVLPNPMSMEQWNAGIDDHPFQTNRDEANQLRVKHLLSPGAFQGWFRNRNVKFKTQAETKPGQQPQQGQEKVLPATASDSDPCIAIHILYKRANYLRSVAIGDDTAVPNYSKAAALYLQQITTFGKTYTGADGKPCAVTVSGTSAGQPGQTGQPTGAGGAATPQQLHSVAQYMPLVLESINFQRISAFFRAYEQLLSATQNSTQWTALQGYKTAFNEAYNEIKNLTLTPMDVFPLYGGPKQVYLWLKPPQNDRYVPFIQKLQVALEAAKNAIQLFYSSYAQARSSEDRVIFTPEEKEIIESQILGYSIYHQNLKALSRWENAQNEIAGIVRK